MTKKTECHLSHTIFTVTVLNMQYSNDDISYKIPQHCSRTQRPRDRKALCIPQEIAEGPHLGRDVGF